MTSVNTFDRGQGGVVTSIEALVLAAMAAIIIAIAIPSWVAMRDRSADSSARAQVRLAGDAADLYRAEHGSFAGLSLVALSRLDPSLHAAAYRLGPAGPGGYCIESTVSGRTWRLTGPAGGVARGSCP